MAFKILGSEVNRLDGREKATGELKYMGDIQLENMCHLKLVHPPVAHAVIKGLDVSKAEKLEGVVAVVTADDIPGDNCHGLVYKDQPVICSDRVRYMGDSVAVIAAETPDIAEKAAELIEIDYDPLPVYSTAKEALAPGAYVIQDNYPGNCIFETTYDKGDLEEGFDKASFIADHTYSAPYQSHSYLETEAGAARPLPGGGVEVWCPSQNGSRVLRDLVTILNLPKEKIRVHSHPLGGAFGGKDDLLLQGILCVSALKTGRPVTLTLSREESFLLAPKRVPMEFHMRTGIDRDGHIVAHEVDILGTSGAYCSYAAGIVFFALENAACVYRVPNYRVHASMAVTNNAFCSAMRGFGNNQINFAIENQMDILAEESGIDPLTLRLINTVGKGERFVYGQTISPALYAVETLKRIEDCDFWKNREEWKKASPKPWIRRGVGVAVCQHGNGIGSVVLDDFSEATVILQKDGRLQVRTGNEDMGQGSITTLAMIAAEGMGMPLSNIDILCGDTAFCPDSGPITASRTTYITGRAILSAEAMLKEKISEKLRVVPEDLNLENESINGIPYAGIAAMLSDEERMFTAKESFTLPPEWNTYSFGVHYMTSQITQAAGVEVDTLTGQTRVVEFVTAPSAGPVINKLGYEGQCEGGAVMGQGYATTERYVSGADGRPVTKNFQTYLLPTMADMPHVTILPVEDKIPCGPYGARGIGEPSTVPSASCITNAICDALGFRLYDMPFDQEKVLLAIRDHEKAGKEA